MIINLDAGLQAATRYKGIRSASYAHERHIMWQYIEIRKAFQKARQNALR